jgi:DNA polymerase-3 subunit gamma/tau
MNISINSMLGGEAKSEEELAEEALKAIKRDIDPDSEAKLMAVKAEFVKRLMNGRPRLGIVFDTMKAEGNVMVLTVASKGAEEEVLLKKMELQNEIAQLAGIEGALDIRVIVNEQIRVARPITLEDRLKYLMGKNERLRDAIEAFSLEAE